MKKSNGGVVGAVTKIAEPLAEELGYFLWDVEYVKEGADMYLRITIDSEEGIDIDLAVEERKPGDLWLICSDGLHGMVSDKRMEAILGVNAPESAVKLLMDAALAAGGRDNISVVLVQDGEVAR